MSVINIESPWTPAHQAVESGDHAMLTRLLDEGADVNEVCCAMTLLEHAIELEGDSALQSGRPIDSALTAILLAYGADPTLTVDGKTAYEMAKLYNHDMAIRLLDRFTNQSHGRPARFYVASGMRRLVNPWARKRS